MGAVFRNSTVYSFRVLLIKEKCSLLSFSNSEAAIQLSSEIYSLSLYPGTSSFPEICVFLKIKILFKPKPQRNDTRSDSLERQTDYIKKLMYTGVDHQTAELSVVPN